MKPLLTSISLGVVLVSLMTFGPHGTRADELPEDTDKIESLTPEQAQTLVDEFPGVDVHLKFKGSRHSFRKSLPLHGLKTLDAATARALSNHHGPLILSGLTTLEADVLEVFKKPGTGGGFKGGSSAGGADGFVWFTSCEGPVLHVDGLDTLDATTAKALVDRHGMRWSGILSHLEKLDIDTARVLAGFRGDLFLNGLTTLDADVAKALVAGDRGFLGLDGVKILDADTAKALAEFKGHILSLGGLTELDADTARAFAGSTCKVGLHGLTTLDADTARALAAFKGEGLLLNGLTRLDAETAGVLAGFKGVHLCFNGLTTLDAETATRLAGFKGYHLVLNGLTMLDADTARALAEFKGGGLFLNGLTALDTPDAVAIAKALATREGRLSLPNLKRISPKTLAALLQKNDVEIPLTETLELIPEPDGSVTEDFIVPEWLSERESRVKSEQKAKRSDAKDSR